jgi:hemerythrin
MDQFIWKDSFGIGVDEIDNEHKTLLKHLNECLQKGEAADIKPLLKELRTYVDTHFATEEKLMRLVNYPDFDLHLKQHHLLTEEVAKLERELAGKGKNIRNSMLTLLIDWYIQHILEYDKRIGAYVLSNKQVT